LAINFSSITIEMFLNGAIGAGDTILDLDAITGLPDPDFDLVIDPGESNEEIVTATAVDDMTNEVTVLRGQDGTVATTHNPGASVRHMFIGGRAQELFDYMVSETAAREAHEADTTSVHGIADTGNLVDTNSEQTLSTKTIDADSNTITNIGDDEVVGLSGTKITSAVAEADDADTANGIKPFTQNATPSHSGPYGSAFWIRIPAE
jgi:hypothetical protein